MDKISGTKTINQNNLSSLFALPIKKQPNERDQQNYRDGIADEMGIWLTNYFISVADLEKKYKIKISLYLIEENIIISPYLLKINNAYALPFGLVTADATKGRTQYHAYSDGVHYGILIGNELLSGIAGYILMNSSKIHDILGSFTHWADFKTTIACNEDVLNRFIFYMIMSSILSHELLHIMRFKEKKENCNDEEKEADNLAGFLNVNFFSTLINPQNAKHFYPSMNVKCQIEHACKLVMTGTMVAADYLRYLRMPDSGSDEEIFDKQYPPPSARLITFVEQLLIYFYDEFKEIDADIATKILAETFTALTGKDLWGLLRYVNELRAREQQYARHRDNNNNLSSKKEQIIPLVGDILYLT